MSKTFAEHVAAIPPAQMAEAVEAFDQYKAAHLDYLSKRARYRRLEAALGDDVAGLMFVLGKRERFALIAQALQGEGTTDA